MSLQEDLDFAIEMLQKWREAAKSAAVGGKQYSVGSRNLTRYSPDEIQRQISYWQVEVDTCKKGMGSSMHGSRIIPGGN